MPTYEGRPVDLVVDVRSRLEFMLGHLPGAVCIPHDQLPDALARRAGVTKASRIVLYCASGARSGVAAGALRAAGYDHVSDAGGLATAREAIAAR